MEATARRSLIPPAPVEDAYAALLSGTRRLQRDQRALRDQWHEALELEHKDEILFEFEVLLKAAACFSNPRNHPGRQRRAPVVAQNYRAATQLACDGFARAVGLARTLLGNRERALVFHRYLETVLPEDQARSRLLTEGTSQRTPEESLIALRHALIGTVEVADGIVRAPRVSFRMFHALLSTAYREIDRNAFFNPLNALEFRPEFDRIRSAQVLDLIRSVPGLEAHRLVALTFLSLFRMLRYLSLLERLSGDESGSKRLAAGSSYLVLSVLRSDARALSDHLRRRAGRLLAESFERDVLATPASSIRERAPALHAAGHRLLGIKSALEGIAGGLRLDFRRAFQHDLPEPEAIESPQALSQAVEGAVRNLRPALKNAILFLGKALGVSLDEGGVFDERAARRETGERLRRDIWMFAQIVRAFATKAHHAPGTDAWAALQSFQYVREFLAYFRAMGYPLLRASDYPRVDAFMSAMSALEDTDLIDPVRLRVALEECVAFHGFLSQLFEDISRREELVSTPFDRHAAASTLRLYLGD
jgi:hypothetical protein